MPTSCKIGIDGGGTKTGLILVGPDGTILARHTAPGCNPSHLGAAQARRILTEALDALLAQTPGPRPPVSSTHIYAAGAAAFWQETAAALTGFGKVTTGPDSLPVLELATGGKPGLVLHAGTGSFVAARAPDGTLHYAGGLGWRFGDPGSGTDIGRRATARALLELQGWTKRTSLADALCAHTGLAEYGTISRLLYTADDANARIAAFAPLVIELAAAGNASAQLSLVESLTELVAQARLVTERLFPGTVATCGVSGALLNAPPSVATLRALVGTQSWPVALQFITEPPIEGVRRLLARS